MNSGESTSAVIMLPERLTGDNIQELRQRFESCFARRAVRITANALNLDYINSYGIGFLVKMLKQTEMLGGSMVIENLQGYILDMFKRTGLAQVFTLTWATDGAPKKQEVLKEEDDGKMDIQYEQRGNVAVFHLSGVMAFPHGVRKFKETVYPLMADLQRFVLDFDRLSYLDSAAVGEIMSMNALLSSSQGEIRICNLHEMVKELFTTLNLDSIFRVFSSVEDALRDW